MTKQDQTNSVNRDRGGKKPKGVTTNYLTAKQVMKRIANSFNMSVMSQDIVTGTTKIVEPDTVTITKPNGWEEEEC